MEREKKREMTISAMILTVGKRQLRLHVLPTSLRLDVFVLPAYEELAVPLCILFFRSDDFRVSSVLLFLFSSRLSSPCSRGRELRFIGRLMDG
jgi:hypothetical protein